MMAAGRAAERDRRVLLLERGPSLGRKLLLSGGGRCNVTNTAPLAEFLGVFGRQGGFLRNALTALGSNALRDWLRARGIGTVAEEGGRVFPAAGGAKAVHAALAGYMSASGAQVRLGERVKSLLTEQGRLAGVRGVDSTWEAPRVVVATGGLSYPATGSTGDGYDLARQAGHSLLPAYPMLVGLETVETWPRQLQGVSLKDAVVCVREAAGQRLARCRGEALWTHYGLSGPAVLDVSGAAMQVLARGQQVAVELDLAPGLSAHALEGALREAAGSSSRQALATVLVRWVPRRTAAPLLAAGGLDGRKKMAQCSRHDLQVAVQALKCLRLHVARARPIAEAIVTGGGVDVREVDARRMESRLLKGLHFAGEVLAVHGPSGGFNMQAALSTGWLAGDAA